jgi:hypothetical protein
MHLPRSSQRRSSIAEPRRRDVIIWHLLSRNEDYAFGRPALLQAKVRQMDAWPGARLQHQGARRARFRCAGGSGLHRFVAAWSEQPKSTVIMRAVATTAIGLPRFRMMRTKNEPPRRLDQEVISLQSEASMHAWHRLVRRVGASLDVAHPVLVAERGYPIRWISEP